MLILLHVTIAEVRWMKRASLQSTSGDSEVTTTDVMILDVTLRDRANVKWQVFEARLTCRLWSVDVPPICILAFHDFWIHVHRMSVCDESHVFVAPTTLHETPVRPYG